MTRLSASQRLCCLQSVSLMLLYETVMCNIALVTGGFIWRPGFCFSGRCVVEGMLQLNAGPRARSLLGCC